MLTAQQVSTMLGPETPGCDCRGCKVIVDVKRLICDDVTKTSQTMDTEDAASAWLAVVMIAASRLRAQGVDPNVLGHAAAQGVTQAEDLNPLLCLMDGHKGATKQ